MTVVQSSITKRLFIKTVRGTQVMSRKQNNASVVLQAGNAAVCLLWWEEPTRPQK